MVEVRYILNEEAENINLVGEIPWGYTYALVRQQNFFHKGGYLEVKGQSFEQDCSFKFSNTPEYVVAFGDGRTVIVVDVETECQETPIENLTKVGFILIGLGTSNDYELIDCKGEVQC